MTNVTNVTNVAANNSTPIVRREGSDGGGGHDPLAQTFTLAQSWCLSSIRLMCAKIGSRSNSIAVQLRKRLKSECQRKRFSPKRLSPAPIWLKGEVFTARFNFPVFLQGGREFAFVALTDDAEHSLFVAEIGKIDLDTQAVISEQPFTVGVLLSSSNASTWTVHNEADLWFEMIGCRFDPVERVVPIGTFKANKMSDVIIRAGVEYPDPSVDVSIRLRRPSGETITTAPSQTIRFDEYIQNEDIQVEAILRGTERITPFLFPDIQIIEGEIQPTANYATRAIDAADANRVLVTLDARLPAGSSATVQIGMPDDYPNIPVSSATQLGDGLVEQTFIRSAYPAANLDARTLITITGTPAARPEISAVRMLLSKV